MHLALETLYLIYLDVCHFQINVALICHWACPLWIFAFLTYYNFGVFLGKYFLKFKSTSSIKNLTGYRLTRFLF